MGSSRDENGTGWEPAREEPEQSTEDTSGYEGKTGFGSGVGVLLHGGPTTAQDLKELEDKLFFIPKPKSMRKPGEGPDITDSQDRLVRFFVMLGLSAIIATGGVLADSTAVVIGAMIIAPLMTPILASALCIATGRGVRFVRQFSVVLVGILVVLTIAILGAIFKIGPLELTSNSQVISRTSPNTLDMLIALASGLAGAFAVSRAKVGDALPGVAISISLVPPLCVTGLSIAEGEWGFVLGSGLLFATNLTAILVAGSLVFLILGFGDKAYVGEEFSEKDRRRGLRLVWLSMGIIGLLLLGATYGIVQQQFLTGAVNRSVDQWVEGTGWSKAEVRVSAPTEALCGVFENCPTPEVTVTVGGETERPDTADLVAILDEEWERPLNLVVNFIPLARDLTTTGSSDASSEDGG